MSRIENLLQRGLNKILKDEYLIWNIYLPTKEIKPNFENIRQVLGEPVASFKGSYPSQKPKAIVTNSEEGDLVVNISVYKIDIISLPIGLTKKHILKINNDDSIYMPTVDLSDDLINRNISLEVELIK